MEQLLQTLFQKSIELGDVEYSSKEIKHNWIGNPPVTLEEIQQVEEKLGVELPEDYKTLLLVANGFKTCNDAVEPSFMSIEKIDFLKNIDPELIEIWSDGNLIDIGKNLARSILIAGEEEEQQFLLIPPLNEKEKWKYWKFASWIPGENEYDSLKDYVKAVIKFIDNCLEEK